MSMRLLTLACLFLLTAGPFHPWAVLPWAVLPWAAADDTAGAAATASPPTLQPVAQHPVTWDGRHSLERVLVKVVYFVPADRQPLSDWKERAQYYCRSIELFHLREFDGQSLIEVVLEPEPLISKWDTAQLRVGDANAIYYRTLRETAERLAFPAADEPAFPILLVLSDINWRPLDDFYRLKPTENGELAFEGNYFRGRHFPGAAAGGSRASFRSRDRVGWGLVSADGWRVPYRGSDCVIYHEGCGHTVGLPHPEPSNASVMSQGQYNGWLNESWLDRDQKLRLGWTPERSDQQLQSALETRGYTLEDLQLYNRFTALPVPNVPQPLEPVSLQLTWPEDTRLSELVVSHQTALQGPWVTTVIELDGEGTPPTTVPLATFQSATPVSYRVQAKTQTAASIEQWGYLQVRQTAEQPPLPYPLPIDLMTGREPTAVAAAPQPLRPDAVVDLLQLADPESVWTAGGQWKRQAGILTSPKAYGARIEIPFTPPREYRLVMNVKPIGEVNAALLGFTSGGHRCLALLNFGRGDDVASALENVDGQNVGNETTYRGTVLQPGVVSQVVLTVTEKGVQVSVDGRGIIHWQGDANRLSLSDYWKTPTDDAFLIGAYNTELEVTRLTLEPL